MLHLENPALCLPIIHRLSWLCWLRYTLILCVFRWMAHVVKRKLVHWVLNSMPVFIEIILTGWIYFPGELAINFVLQTQSINMTCICVDFICILKNTVLFKEILDWSLAEVIVYLRESERTTITGCHFCNIINCMSIETMWFQFFQSISWIILSKVSRQHVCYKNTSIVSCFVMKNRSRFCFLGLQCRIGLGCRWDLQ